MIIAHFIRNVNTINKLGSVNDSQIVNYFSNLEYILIFV